MSAPTSVISVSGLSKHFNVPTRAAGLKASFNSLFRRTYKKVKAVDDISFSIEPGEVVGFLGPNGAGKTTTLKMLSGLLYPTGGTTRRAGVRALATVNGFFAAGDPGHGEPLPAHVGPASIRFV